MEYDDFACLKPDEYETLARAYASSLKEKGFIFVQLDSEGKEILIDEMFDLMFKLRASYRALGRFMGCDRFYALNEEQLALLREKLNLSHKKAMGTSATETVEVKAATTKRKKNNADHS